MGNIVKTAKCRFCGQMTQIEADEKLTAAQAEEQATMTSLAGLVVVLMMLVQQISDLFELVKTLFSL